LIVRRREAGNKGAGQNHHSENEKPESEEIYPGEETGLFVHDPTEHGA
jgi:hypothetical protein